MNEDDAQKCFLAARTDGLGERLRAMINAIILADHFGVAFKFIWPLRGANAQQHHAVLSPHLTFNRTFLTRHHLDKIKPADYPALKGRAQPQEEIRQLLDSPIKGLSVSQEPITRLIELRDLKYLRGKYSRAFRRIRFSRPVQAAVDAARLIPLPDNAVAVHLRAGDIVYGNFRYASPASSKAVCYPVVKRLIADLIAQGKQPVIFGQDRIVCRMLADRFHVPLAAELLGHADVLVAAVSEIVLMSRCETIYAGSSGFSILASLIGDKKMEIPAAAWSPQQIVDIIQADEELHDAASPLPALQRAFAFYMIANAGQDFLSAGVMITALGKALDNDSSNAFYALNKASLEAQDGRPDVADATLKAVLAAQDHALPLDQTVLYQVVRRAVVKRRLTERLAAPLCLQNLARYAIPDHPYITYVTALAALQSGSIDDAGRLASRALSRGPDNHRLQELLTLCRTAGASEDSLASPAVATDLAERPAATGLRQRLSAAIKSLF